MKFPWPIPRWAAYVAVAALAFGGYRWWHHVVYTDGYGAARGLYEEAAARGAKIHAGELIHAHDAKISEVARVRAWADAHSVGPVFLSVRPVVSAGGATGAGACTAGGDVQPVPAGDHPAGPGGGTDVGPLLEALALHADVVTLANLREAQNVK